MKLMVHNLLITYQKRAANTSENGLSLRAWSLEEKDKGKDL